MSGAWWRRRPRWFVKGADMSVALRAPRGRGGSRGNKQVVGSEDSPSRAFTGRAHEAGVASSRGRTPYPQGEGAVPSGSTTQTFRAGSPGRGKPLVPKAFREHEFTRHEATGIHPMDRAVPAEHSAVNHAGPAIAADAVVTPVSAAPLWVDGDVVALLARALARARAARLTSPVSASANTSALCLDGATCPDRDPVGNNDDGGRA